MISLTQLKAHLAAYPEAPQRTTELEQRIQIGTGFHGKWYRSQCEHMLGWMVVQECQERKKGKDPLAVDAMGMWGRLKCSPLMFWLAECSGVSDDTLVRAQEMAVAAARINDKDGDPHGKMMREVLPWEIIKQAILTGREPASSELANAVSLEAFDRLTEKVSAYRPLRNWLILNPRL
jgi:hypothetical protein